MKTHLSSWGFISDGNDDKNTRTGASLEETIKFLIAENKNKDSIFCHKQGNTEAGKAFYGENAEINSNSMYQDVQVYQ
ncbi:MAG: hypothetical protein NC355_09960 [Blautia sp.]|nr:hypothetical protein [Blautia sp.]